jgi:arylsulfatase A-like enzyme
VIWGDDVGLSNISAYSMGLMGYQTPNIDRIAEEGMIFTDYYGEQSCTAGRSSFITGQWGFRTGLSKVGMPGAKEGMQIEDPTIAGLLKAQGYATGQFGKNHLGDLDEMLPAGAYTVKFLATFEEFPPRQKAASFTIGDSRLGDRSPEPLRSTFDLRVVRRSFLPPPAGTPAHALLSGTSIQGLNSGARFLLGRPRARRRPELGSHTFSKVIHPTMMNHT